MKESLVRFDQSLMPNQQPAKHADPCEGPLHDPSVSIPTQLPTILMACLPVRLASRNDRLDSTPTQRLAKWVAVVRTVGNQSVRIPAWAARPMSASHRDVLQRRLHQLHFRRGRRVQVCSKRSTRAIDQYHPLCALSSLRFADFRPPFFAGAKLPSMKHSSHRIRSSSANSARNARHNESSVPFSSHSFSRRQQVEGLAYRPGSSLQGAPVHRIHRIPSKQSRLSTRGRPPLGFGFASGRCRETASHCSFVKCLQAIDHLLVISGSGAILAPQLGL